MDEHLGYFHILAMMNKALANMGLQIFLQDIDFISKTLKKIGHDVWRKGNPSALLEGM